MNRHLLVVLVFLALAGAHVLTYRHLAATERLLAESRSNEERLKDELAAQVSLVDSLRTSRSSSLGMGPELLKLRGEAANLRRLLAEQATNRTAPRVASPPAAESPDRAPIVQQVTPVGSLSFEGYLTPEAGVQSVIWSMSNGNVESYLDSLTPEARASAEKGFKNKSREEISQALREEVAGIKGLRLDQIQFESESSISINLSSTETDDGSSKFRDTTVIRLVRVDGLWKMANP